MRPLPVPAGSLRDRALGAAAFTLVELLVTLTIIALLVAMVLPAIRTVRELATKTRFCSNLRQVASALHGYAQDNKNRFPASTMYMPTFNLHWHDLVRPYLDSETNADTEWNNPQRYKTSILHDPSDKTVSQYSGWCTRNVGLNGYAVFFHAALSWHSVPGWDNGTATIDPVRFGGAANRVIGQMENPSELMLCGPGVCAEQNNEWGAGAILFTPNMTGHGVNGFIRYRPTTPYIMADGHLEGVTKDFFWGELAKDWLGGSRFFDRAMESWSHH